MTIHAVDAARWKDLVKLFGERGGCWCMSWRLTRSEFDANKGEGNKRALQKLVKRGEPVGVMAYDGAEAIGWCAVAPREEYVRLENSRVLARIDAEPVWSVTCLFVAKEYRGKGVSVALLKGAIEFCRKNGVKIVEGYPEEPYASKIPDAFAWKGIPSAFRNAGFVVAEQRTPKKPIMRFYIKKGKKK